MTQSLGMRATSVAASAVFIGLAVFAAFSVTISLQTQGADSPFVIPVFQEAAPEAPPPIARPQAPPPTAPAQETDMAVADPPPQTETTTDVVFDFGPPVGPTEITNPRWLRRPQSLASYYPRRALARDISGLVVLDCLVDTNGALNCAVVAETPTNWGFGEAALRIAQDHRMVPAMRDGQAVQGRYRMRVPFELD
ncbi:energy transducer TonB [Candidatus Viadribacter manganicus]|nr:energy transducer TonB [Candidatus Viadribacter manganicus]